MVITLYIYSVHERMKVWMKKTTIYQFEDIVVFLFDNSICSHHMPYTPLFSYACNFVCHYQHLQLHRFISKSSFFHLDSHHHSRWSLTPLRCAIAMLFIHSWPLCSSPSSPSSITHHHHLHHQTISIIQENTFHNHGNPCGWSALGCHSEVYGEPKKSGNGGQIDKERVLRYASHQQGFAVCYFSKGDSRCWLLSLIFH